MTLPVVTVDVAFTTDPAASPAWTTVPYAKGFTLRRGRSAEGDKFLAGRATVLLANEDRRFDPSYTASPYYPNVVPMRRVRVRADWDAPSHLDLPGAAGAYVSTPDTPANSLAGATVLHLPGIAGNYATAPDPLSLSTQGNDLDIRVKVALDDWTPAGINCLVSKYQTAGKRAWYFGVTTAGQLRFQISVDGSAVVAAAASTVNLSTLANGAVKWCRVTRRQSDGRVQYFTSDDGVTWAQLGVDTAAVGAIWDSDDTLGIGARSAGGSEALAGNIYYAEVRSGIDGSVIHKFDPSTVTPTSDQVPTTLVSSTGETWTMTGTRWNWRRDNEVRSLRLTGVSGVNASAPDSTALSITGDIDLRAKVSLDDWTPAANQALVAKWINGSPGNQSYYFQVLAAGTLRLMTSADGTATVIAISTVAPTVADGAVLWLRVTRDVDNGAAGNDTKFYTSTDGITWVQLGTTVTVAGATTISDNTQPVRIGTQSNGTTDPLTGNIYYAEIRNNILDDGTGIVANPSFENQPWDVGDTGAATGTDTATVANTWTLNGAAIIQRAFAADLDIRMKLSMDDWTPAVAQAFVAKFATSGSQRSYRFRTQTASGSLIFEPSVDGILEPDRIATVGHGFVDGTTHWIRVTFDADNGAGGNDTKFYTSDDGVTWTQLGATVTTAGITSLFDSTAPLEIGTSGVGTSTVFAGNIYEAEVRRGIDGVVVASPDFAAGNGNVYTATTLTDPQGNVWTRQGSATFATVPTTYDVFNGYVDGWEQNYEHPKVAHCVLTATDAFKVLANIDLPPSVYAVEVAADTPTAWWRLGDPAGATLAFEQGGGSGLVIQGAPTFGTAGLVVREADTAVSHPTAVDGMSTTRSVARPLTFEVVIQTTDDTGAVGGLVVASGDTQDRFFLEVAGGTVSLKVGTSTDAVQTVTAAGTVNDGAPHHLAATWDAAGVATLYVDGVATGTPVTRAGPIGATHVVWVGGGVFGGLGADGLLATFDEVAVYATALSAVRLLAHSRARATAWSGELSGARINRLLDAGGWPATDRQIDVGMSVLQGADLGGSLLAALQKVEETEQGRLFVTADGKVRFISRDNLLKTPYTVSQATYGDTGSELEYEELVYRYDDQTIYNEAHVSRAGGTVAVVSDATSQARYMRRVKTIDGLLHVDDATSIDLANWVVAHYKDPLLRVTDLALHPAVNEVTHFPQVLGTELAERVTVRRTPQCLGAAIDQAVHVEGVEHQVTATDWVTKWNLSPAETQAYWIAGVVGSSEAGVSTRAGFRALNYKHVDGEVSNSVLGAGRAGIRLLGVARCSHQHRLRGELEW